MGDTPPENRFWSRRTAAIRLAAVKGIGKPVMEAIVEERSANGPFRSLKDFAERMSGKEVNKRTVENFIKAGAFDCFGVTRKQLMFVYSNVLDDERARKRSLRRDESDFEIRDDQTVPCGGTRMSENTKRVIFWRSKKRCSASTSAVIRSMSSCSAGGRNFAGNDLEFQPDGRVSHPCRPDCHRHYHG